MFFCLDRAAVDVVVADVTLYAVMLVEYVFS